MKVLKRMVGLDLNRKLCVERSDYEWLQIEHAVYRNDSDKTSVCDVVVSKLKQAVGIVDGVDRVMVASAAAAAAALEGMAHVYATKMKATAVAVMTKMDANRNCF